MPSLEQYLYLGNWVVIIEILYTYRYSDAYEHYISKNYSEEYVVSERDEKNAGEGRESRPNIRPIYMLSILAEDHTYCQKKRSSCRIRDLFYNWCKKYRQRKKYTANAGAQSSFSARFYATCRLRTNQNRRAAKISAKYSYKSTYNKKPSISWCRVVFPSKLRQIRHRSNKAT